MSYVMCLPGDSELAPEHTEEQNMKWKLVKLVIFAAVIIAVTVSTPLIGFFMTAINDDRMSKKEITEYVAKNHEIIERAVSDLINRDPAEGDIAELIKIPECNGIKSIYFYGKDERIQFYCGGYGLGSATGYEGFYYSLSGTGIKEDNAAIKADMSFLGYDAKYKFMQDGDGWRWKEADGDNAVYIEHIVGDFYYYLEEY